MDYVEKVLYAASKVGYHMLVSGGEIYRVEDTICRLLQNYGMREIHAFTSPTLIIASCMYEGKTYTKVLRVNNRSANIHLVDVLNQLSRSAKDLSIDELNYQLTQVVKEQSVNHYCLVLFSGLAAFGFTMFFNGSLKDSLWAFMIGCLLRICMMHLKNRDINGFVISFLGSFLITFLTLLIEQWHLLDDRNLVIIGAIMLLVPGLAITNAIKDFLSDDLVSGITRTVEAFLIAIFIAVGSGIALMLWVKLGGLL